MSNAFNWKGAPSIFTTHDKQRKFGAVMNQQWLATSLRRKAAPVSLAGGSPYPEPDMLTKGGELGKKRNTGAKK